MKVLHIIDTIARTSGGPARSSQGLVAALNDAGVDTLLLSLKPGEKPWLEGVKKYYNNVDVEKLLMAEKPDIVHINNIWRPEIHRCVKICQRLKIPYIMTPRGSLEPWSLKHKWLKKRIARWVYQDSDIRHAVALQATAESEAAQFRHLGFTNPIIVSPNGVNLPKEFEPRKDKSGKPRMLFVSRMHPKKGVLELVESFGRIVNANGEKGIGDWMCELVYTLNGDFEREYEDKVKAKVKSLGLEDVFVFTGPLDDDAKWDAYRRADVFVLPTYSENFGIVVAEAMYAGLPVITTKGAPWQELETNKCGWWIDLPPQADGAADWQALDSALIEAMRLRDDERVQMGARGRKLVEQKYTWSAVVKRMVEGYREITKMRSKARRYGRRGAKSDFSFCLQLINNNGKIQEIQH